MLDGYVRGSAATRELDGCGEIGAAGQDERQNSGPPAQRFLQQDLVTHTGNVLAAEKRFILVVVKQQQAFRDGVGPVEALAGLLPEIQKALYRVIQAHAKESDLVHGPGRGKSASGALVLQGAVFQVLASRGVTCASGLDGEQIAHKRRGFPFLPSEDGRSWNICPRGSRCLCQTYASDDLRVLAMAERGTCGGEGVSYTAIPA